MPAVLWMILANYLSGWFGLYVLVGVVRDHTLPLEHLIYLHGALIVAAYLVTVAIEWPFVFRLLRSRKRRIWRSLKACMYVRLASCTMMVGWLAGANDLSLLTETSFVGGAEFPWKSEPRVFLSDGDVAGIQEFDPRTEAVAMVSDREELNHLYRLVTATSASVKGRWALFATLGSVQAIPTEDELESRLWGREVNQRIADLRPPSSRGVSFWVDVMSPHAIRANHGETGKFEQLALTSPLFDVNFTDAVVLPGDQILFDANQQVYVLDWSTRTLAALGPASRSLKLPETGSNASNSRR